MRKGCLLFAGGLAVPTSGANYVMADPVRLGQCFSILFTNAAKYTNLGGRIEVSPRAGRRGRGGTRA